MIDDDREFEGTARRTQTVDPKDIAELKLGGYRWGLERKRAMLVWEEQRGVRSEA